jgi:hypothetical protein
VHRAVAEDPVLPVGDEGVVRLRRAVRAPVRLRVQLMNEEAVDVAPLDRLQTHVGGHAPGEVRHGSPSTISFRRYDGTARPHQ